MTSVYVSQLHCESCSADLLKKLEEITGVAGFQYDPAEEVLMVPDEANLRLVHQVLGANKIAELKAPEEASSELHALGEADTGHSHSQGHSHSHASRDASVKSLMVVFGTNLLFSIIEFVAGILFNSTAIFSDAVHDLGDAVSTGTALVLEKKSMKHADGTYTFGQRRFSLLGALITGLILIIGSGIALFRAIPRFFAPEPVEATGMLWLAVVAIGLNLVSAVALLGRKSRSERMLQLHMLEDVLGWVAILIISVILQFKPWYFLDPLVSVGISLYILHEAIPQTIGTIRILMESVPEDVDVNEISDKLLQIQGVHGLTHLHLWSMDGQDNNFAVTLFTADPSVQEQDRIKTAVRQILVPYHVTCSTIEVNYDPDRLFE